MIVTYIESDIIINIDIEGLNLNSSWRNIEADFDLLIDLMADMIDAQAVEPRRTGDDWIADAQTLAVKLFKQLCSARSLLAPIVFQKHNGATFQFIDHSSLVILVRACIETYIAMHWIFGSEDIEFRKFRHRVWKLGGLMDRLKLHHTTDEARRKIEETRLQAEELITEIKASTYFDLYFPKQAKRILKGDWRVDWSWTDEAVRAGFHKKYFETIYGHFCGYAHSSYISSMQISQARDINDQYMLAQASMQAGVHIMAHFIYFYSKTLIAPNVIFNAADEAKRVATIWHFKAEDMDYLYVSLESSEHNPKIQQ